MVKQSDTLIGMSEADLVQVLIGEDGNVLLRLHPSEHGPDDRFPVEDLPRWYGERGTVHFHAKNYRLAPTLHKIGWRSEHMIDSRIVA